MEQCPSLGGTIHGYVQKRVFKASDINFLGDAVGPTNAHVWLARKDVFQIVRLETLYGLCIDHSIGVRLTVCGYLNRIQGNRLCMSQRCCHQRQPEGVATKAPGLFHR